MAAGVPGGRRRVASVRWSKYGRLAGAGESPGGGGAEKCGRGGCSGRGGVRLRSAVDAGGWARLPAHDSAAFLDPQVADSRGAAASVTRTARERKRQCRRRPQGTQNAVSSRRVLQDSVEHGPRPRPRSRPSLSFRPTGIARLLPLCVLALPSSVSRIPPPAIPMGIILSFLSSVSQRISSNSHNFHPPAHLAIPKVRHAILPLSLNDDNHKHSSFPIRSTMRRSSLFAAHATRCNTCQYFSSDLPSCATRFLSIHARMLADRYHRRLQSASRALPSLVSLSKRAVSRGVVFTCVDLVQIYLPEGLTHSPTPPPTGPCDYSKVRLVQLSASQRTLRARL